MLATEFESLYFELDIIFQEILEELHIFDTFSMDTFDLDWMTQTVTFNWRGLRNPIEILGPSLKLYIKGFKRIKNNLYPRSLLGEEYGCRISRKTKKEIVQWLVNEIERIA